MRLSVVVPVYNEEKNVLEYLTRTVLVLERITSDFEIIFALDPGRDQTEQVILNAHSKDPRIKLLKFSRRFGQPMATLGGLQHSSGEAVIVMDVDLQDPPELIAPMIAKWREEGFDVVYAERRSREGETLIKRIVSYVGYKMIHKITEGRIPPHTGDFRLMSRRVVDEINRLKECHGFLRGMVAVVGFKQTAIQYDRPARFSGKGHYNRFLGSLKIGLNGFFCFSNSPLSLSSQLGFAIVGIALFLGLTYMITKLLGFALPFDHPTLIFLLLFIGGVQLISVGILGEYVGRIYDEVKQRPRFIIDRKVGFE